MAENNCVPPTDMFASASSLPKALVDKNGLPYKSTKSSTTKYLMKRYKDSPIISSHLPWFPTSVILEGMFMIQSAPLPTNENMKEYANMLFIRYVKFHYTSNAIDVHVFFDNPGGLPESPKEIEQGRRDAATLTEQHQCLATIASSTAVPKNWRLFLGCRTCKAKLTSYLAEEFLQVAPGYMRNSDQEFFSNQKGRVYSVNQHNELLQRPSYFTNMDEADMRIWLHCMHGSGQRVLIFSPDTDVYHIGLVVAQHIPHKSIVIQLSKSLVDSASFLDLNALLQALQGDPDLCNLPPPLRPQALQSLYVCTGCDYISFFAGIGKCTFLSTFFQYASFIASGSDPPGSIGQISLNHSDLSLYSFMRLVGCAYFRSHTSAFEHTSPVSLYHSLSSTTLFDTHKQWLALIRKAVWLRADKESQNVPTAEALRLHWYRCLWVLGIWHSATENEFELPRKSYNL
ncbi:hypothetical protein SPONN_2737 [uncultured Candidatus Thioglobus sp.]|nr:hypothetical protein SPONN_2737 [uncultured Candidatus Thioglobus sp.]